MEGSLTGRPGVMKEKTGRCNMWRSLIRMPGVTRRARVLRERARAKLSRQLQPKSS